MIQLEQADGRIHTVSTQHETQLPSTTISPPSPNISRRTKSITDFHKRARRRSKEQDDPEQASNGFAELSLMSDLDLARSYDENSDALAEATHEKYQ